MKERQRWQPEEDALLRAYVKQYGPRDWNLVSQRMGKPLHRDPKSCLERWKNYLKPGLKKGSLTPEEQSLVISLQAKYGNKWKKIAAEVPGRTAKRLGKWWEVFKEKQLKQQEQQQKKKPASLPDGNIPVAGVNSPAEKAVQGPYDHILETFAEKYVQALNGGNGANAVVLPMPDPDPILSLGSVNSTSPNPSVLPPWIGSISSSTCNTNTTSLSSLSSCTNTTTSSSATPSPSVSLSLSPSELDPLEPGRFGAVGPVHHPNQMGMLMQYCRDVEEGRQSWVSHRKEAAWRLSRLEKQLESEKARKRREKSDEVETEIRRLRDEEAAFLARVDAECAEQLRSLRGDAEAKEAKLVEALRAKHARLASLVERIRLISPN